MGRGHAGAQAPAHAAHAYPGGHGVGGVYGASGTGRFYVIIFLVFVSFPPLATYLVVVLHLLLRHGMQPVYTKRMMCVCMYLDECLDIGFALREFFVCWLVSLDTISYDAKIFVQYLDVSTTLSVMDACLGSRFLGI